MPLCDDNLSVLPAPLWRATVALASTLGLLACGQEPAPPGGAGAAAAVQYLLHTSVDAPDRRLNYFVPVGSLDEGVPVDLARGLEVPGVARLFAPPGGGFFAVGSSEDMIVTRYDLSTEGTLTRSGLVSFNGRGIKRFARTMAFISPSKAYYLDESNAQVVVWNPGDLTVTGTIDLRMVARPDKALKFVRVNYPLRPGRLLTSVTWADAAWDDVVPETGLLVLDTDQDRVAHYEVDTRCRGAAEVVELPSGDIYFASGPDELVSADVRGKSRPACLLRVRAGEERFDPSYLVSLSQLVGDRAACDVIPSGQEEKLLFRALDESRAPWSGADQDIGQAEAWEWWRLDVRTGIPERALELGLAPLYTTYSKTSGRVLFTRKVEEGASSQFLELLPGGVLRPGLVAPGFIWAAVKVH